MCVYIIYIYTASWCMTSTQLVQTPNNPSATNDPFGKLRKGNKKKPINYIRMKADGTGPFMWVREGINNPNGAIVRTRFHSTLDPENRLTRNIAGFPFGSPLTNHLKRSTINLQTVPRTASFLVLNQKRVYQGPTNPSFWVCFLGVPHAVCFNHRGRRVAICERNCRAAPKGTAPRSASLRRNGAPNRPKVGTGCLQIGRHMWVPYFSFLFPLLLCYVIEGNMKNKFISHQRSETLGFW